MQAPPRKVVFLSGTFLLAAILTGLLVRMPEGSPRRLCGHLDDTFSSVSGFKDWIQGKAHHCRGDRVMLDLKMFQEAQSLFEKEYRRPVTNLVELVPYAEWVQRRSYPLHYASEAGRWTLAVDRTTWLPGYYLLTMEGNVYFDELRPATTNDFCLKEARVNTH